MGTQFFSQMPNVNIDGPRIPGVSKPHTVVKKTLPAHRLVAVFKKDCQEIEFFGRQVHHFPFYAHRVFVQIHGEVTRRES
jgi:hypothetical protein